MAEASSSRPTRYSYPDEPLFDSDGEAQPRISSTSSRRRSHYGDQRVSRSTRPSTAETSKSRGKRASYQDPPTYRNVDEEAVPPPVDPDAWKTQHPPTPLEQSLRESRSASQGERTRSKSDTVRKRRSAPPQSQRELTEIAAPPPVPRSRDDTEVGAGAQQTFEGRGDADDDTSSDAADPRARQNHGLEKASQGAEVSKPLTELYTISYLVFFSIWGTLARLGVQWITFYPGTPIVTPVIWANFGGSLIMGFLAEDQAMFHDSSISPQLSAKDKADGKDLEQIRKAEATKRKKTIPLYIGLATGFCGSFTSFSSFARDFFLALSNNLPTPIDHQYSGTAPSPSSTVGRNGGYGFEAFLHVIMATLALSLGGLLVGAQLAVFATPYTPRVHGSFVRNVIDRAAVVLGFGCWLGAVFLAIFPPSKAWRGEAVFALVLAPLGCLLRFYASLKLNGLVAAFPLGTFCVNMFGTAIEGMCFDIQHVRVGVMGRLGGGMVGCQVLQGVMDGFCGCLTTVSTWVAEINALKRKHGWGYAFGSIFGGFCLMVIIMGSVRWSVGYSEPVCNTGYTSKVNG